MQETMGKSYDWDDEISVSMGGDYQLLAAGDYDFEVINFERARHESSPKLPACWQAILTLAVGGDEAATTIKHNLFLHEKTQRLLSAFFAAIGACKDGDTYKMNWSNVIGQKGRCRVGVRDWIKKDGTPGQSNEIAKFYPAELPEATAPTYQQGRF